MKRIAALVLTLSSTMAFAGHETGHGGGGVLCVDKNTGVTAIETADLWNGEQHGLPIPRIDNVDVKTQIKWAIKKISDDGGASETLHDAVKKTMKMAKFIDDGDFPVPQDTGLDNLPENCRLVGIADYFDGFFVKTSTLLINTENYVQLSNTDQAALWLHEALYRLNREVSDKMINEWDQDGRHVSVFTQRLVAFGFSTDDFKTADKQWPLPDEMKKRQKNAAKQRSQVLDTSSTNQALGSK